MLAVKGGDLDSLTGLFERYHRQLFGFFYRMSGDRAAAEDLVQEVFLRVLKYRHTFRNPDSFASWLFQIAWNARHDSVPKRQVMVSLPDDLEVAAPDAGPALRFEQREDVALMSQAMRRLPADKRELIVLARYHGMDYAQLSRLLNAEPGTIRVRLHRAIRQLEEVFCQLKGEGPECVVKISGIG